MPLSSSHLPAPRASSRRAGRSRAHGLTGWVALLGLLASCGEGTERPLPAPLNAEFEGPIFYEPGSDGSGAPASPGLGGLVDGTGSSAPESGEACAEERAEAQVVRQPVDIVLLLDNSGSMSDELGAVEENINVSFASILTSSEVDYRMILISRHREEPRDESDEASTSICVTSPLSGLSDCDAAEQPEFSPRFFQYSTKLESDDSFDVLLDTYAPPFEDSEREEKFDRAPLGWSEWLRPEAKKVFLEMTDDDEDMSAPEFIEALLALAPEHFGTDPAQPTFVFHSIVGLAEKAAATSPYLPAEPVQPATCTGNDNDVENAGESYQELSRITGGLRFPLCQFDAYDVVFQTIAQDVVLTREIACDLEIPPAPRGRELLLSNVAMQYQPGSGARAVLLGQAPSAADCQADAFYIVGNRLNLCPEACTAIRRDRQASFSVLFTCESQLLVPR